MGPWPLFYSSAFPVQMANERFSQKWPLQTLRFLIHFFPVQYVGLSQKGCCVRLGREKNFFQGVGEVNKGSDAFSQFSLIIINSLASYSPIITWLASIPSVSLHFIFPCLRRLPFTGPGPKQQLPALHFRINTEGESFPGNRPSIRVGQ